jgi:hypothetical protein
MQCSTDLDDFFINNQVLHFCYYESFRGIQICSFKLFILQWLDAILRLGNGERQAALISKIAPRASA